MYRSNYRLTLPNISSQGLRFQFTENTYLEWDMPVAASVEGMERIVVCVVMNKRAPTA
jgi:hypothetical protein